jgi:hypothetical protein
LGFAFGAVEVDGGQAVTGFRDSDELGEAGALVQESVDLFVYAVDADSDLAQVYGVT